MTSVWVGKKYMLNEAAPAFEPEYFGAKHITTPNIHPVPGRDPTACSVVGNGLWREKIYHFLPDRPPSSAGDEIQTEFFVRYEDFTTVMDVLYSIRDSFLHLVQVTEVRMCAPDDIPMSPAKGSTAYIGIHFTWYRKHAQIVAALPKIEKALERFNVKPHLGKLFGLSGERFEALYGRDLEILRSLITFHDPTGKFRNEYMDKYIFANSRWKAIVNKSVLPGAKL